TAAGEIANGDEVSGWNRTAAVRERPCSVALLGDGTENSFADRGTRTGRDRSAGKSNRGSDRRSNWSEMRGRHPERSEAKSRDPAALSLRLHNGIPRLRSG